MEGDHHSNESLFLFVLVYLLLPTAILLFYFGKIPLISLSMSILSVYLAFDHIFVSRVLLIDALKKTWPLLICSAITVWLSGIFPPFSENFDWYKHYGLLNLLIDKPWPPAAFFEKGFRPLRYSLSFYILPSIFGKIFSHTGSIAYIYIYIVL